MGLKVDTVKRMYSVHKGMHLSFEAASIWYNIAHLVGVWTLVFYVMAAVMIWIVIGIIPFLVWVALGYVLLVFELIAGFIFLVAAYRSDDKLLSVLTTMSVSYRGICVIGFWASVIKIVSCILFWITQIGFMTIVGAYVLGVVGLTISFQVNMGQDD